MKRDRHDQPRGPRNHGPSTRLQRPEPEVIVLQRRAPRPGATMGEVPRDARRGRGDGIES